MPCTFTARGRRRYVSTARRCVRDIDTYRPQSSHQRRTQMSHTIITSRTIQTLSSRSCVTNRREHTILSVQCMTRFGQREPFAATRSPPVARSCASHHRGRPSRSPAACGYLWGGWGDPRVYCDGLSGSSLHNREPPDRPRGRRTSRFKMAASKGPNSCASRPRQGVRRQTVSEIVAQQHFYSLGATRKTREGFRWQPEAQRGAQLARAID